ncbi:hypothetical protein JTB14_011914 [Gonioctena quinquepunctata]|nr:hypothetical protein JTB14_011914 [Gonioctena quinquepunctata]
MEFLKQPASMGMCGDLGSNWRKFKNNFSLYSIATGCKEKAKEVQAAVLLHCLGEEANEVLETLDLTKTIEICRVAEQTEQYIKDQLRFYDGKLEHDWYETLYIPASGKYLKFKLDTGAHVNVILENIWRILKIGSLKKIKLNITNYGGQTLDVVGSYNLRVVFNECVNISEIEAKVLEKQKKTFVCNTCKSEVNNTSKNEKEKNIQTGQKKGKDKETPKQLGKPVAAMDGCLSELTSRVKELRIEIAEMKESLNFLNELLESERVRNQVLSEMVGELRAENVDLKRDVSYMTSYVNSTEYQKIKNNLAIAGLCKNGNEDLNSMKLNVLSVLKTIVNSVQAEDINEVKLSKTKND